MDRLLMTPGPTMVNERVRRALSLPIMNPDLDNDFFSFYKGLTEKFQKLLHTKEQVLVLGGEGILGLEAACASIIEKGDKVLCLNNGVFGEGFGDFVKMYGGEVTFYTEDYHKPFSPQALETFLQSQGPFKAATMVHCETPSGLMNPIEEICPILKKHGMITVVDAVSSIGGYTIEPDQWGIDMLLGGSQKCLSAPPGLTFLSISQDTWKVIANRKTPIAGFYCNLMLWKDWYAMKYFPYTQPVSDLYALEAAIDILLEEGEAFSERHRKIADKVRKTLELGGFQLYPVKESAANTVTAFLIPEDIDDEAFRDSLWKNHGVMIGGSWGPLAGKVWRIGHMGENCRDAYLYRTFAALDQVLMEFGHTPEKSLKNIYAGL